MSSKEEIENNIKEKDSSVVETEKITIFIFLFFIFNYYLSNIIHTVFVCNSVAYLHI